MGTELEACLDNLNRPPRLGGRDPFLAESSLQKSDLG